MEAKKKPLLFDRRYWPFFWTQFFGAFNDNLFKQSLVILVVFSNISVLGLDSKLFASLATAIFILPYFLFSATGGQLADRHEKGRLVRWIKLAEVGIMGVAAVGFLTGQYALLLVVLFMMGAQSSFFGPVKYGILPQISDDDQLVSANALVEMGTYIAILTGTIVGGLVINLQYNAVDGLHQAQEAASGAQLDNLPVGLWVVCGGIVLVAIIGRTVAGRIVPCPPTDDTVTIQWDPIRPTAQILKLAVSKRVLFLSIIAISWFWSFGGSFLSVFPNYTEEILGGNEQIATLFLALFSIGIAFGSIMAERLSKHRLELGIVPIGALGMSVFCIDLYFVGIPWTVAPDAPAMGVVAFLQNWQAWRICIDLFLIASFGGIYSVPLYTLLQQRADDGSRSRIIAGNNIINAILMVASAIGLMFLLSYVNEITVFLVLGLLNLVCALVVFSQVPEFFIRFVIWMLSNIFYRVRVEGHKNIPVEGPCFIAANHISFVDWMLLAGAIRRPVHFVMDVSFANLPGMRYFARNEWVIPIASPKRDEVAYEQAFVSVRRKLREGWLVGIFPEGMITHDGAFNEFKRGIERMVERDPCSVVPVSINGMWGSWFSRKDGPAMKKRPRGWLSPVVITIGTPIPAEAVTAETIRDRVAELYAAHPNHP